MKDFLEYIDKHSGTDMLVFFCLAILLSMIALFFFVITPALLYHYFGINPSGVVLVQLVVYPLGILIYKYRRQK